LITNDYIFYNLLGSRNDPIALRKKMEEIGMIEVYQYLVKRATQKSNSVLIGQYSVTRELVKHLPDPILSKQKLRLFEKLKDELHINDEEDVKEYLDHKFKGTFNEYIEYFNLCTEYGKEEADLIFAKMQKQVFKTRKTSWKGIKNEVLSNKFI